MRILEETRQFLAHITTPAVMPTAYDTAWVAALPTPDSPAHDPQPRFPASLAWLRAQQHPDGSWGAPGPHYHDRLLSTLRAVLTLHAGRDPGPDASRIERGLHYMRHNAHRLAEDPGATTSFALIFPALLAEAEQRGLRLPYAAFAGVGRQRAAWLARRPLALAYRRDLPDAGSLEGVGAAFDRDRAQDVQEQNGAVGMSPAATAYLLQQWPDNPAAVRYLDCVIRRAGHDGGVPHALPLETLEQSQALYRLQQARPDVHTILAAETRPVIQFLEQTVRTGGWGASRDLTAQDGDTTAVCFAVLSQADRRPDPRLIDQYEEATHFRRAPFEREPSVATNAHMLDALRYCETGRPGPRRAKILHFLRAARRPGGFWQDPCHAGPYYATGLVVQVAGDLAPDLVQPAVEWLIGRQDAGGGWGYYGPTAEETAYALPALLAWRAAGHPVPHATLTGGVGYLRDHWDPAATDYPPLWVGKTLFTPVQAVRATILAALLGGEEY